MPEPVSTPDIGQGAAPAPEQGQANPEPFYSNGDSVFKTKEDLDKAWGDSFLMRKDYTKKTQELAKYRDMLMQREKEYGDKEKTLKEKEALAAKLDNFLRNRPDVYQNLMSQMQAPPSIDVALQRASGYTDEKVSALEQKLSDFEEWKKAQEEERELQSVFGRFRDQYTDFDEGIIREALPGLAERGLEGLVEMIYHANRGKTSPIETEKKVVENIQKKQAARVMPGGPSAPAPTKVFKSIDEAAQIAQTEARTRGG